MSSTKRGESTVEDRSVATITREFNVPRADLFTWFTVPEKAAKWFGTPEGAVSVLLEIDAKPGGTIRIHDREPGGPLHKTTGVIVGLVEPELFSFRSTTALEEGATPFEALQTVTLEEVARGRTRVHVVVKVLSPGAVPGGVPALLEGFAGGWGQTFDKLERALR